MASSPLTDILKSWQPHDSRELYSIPAWGQGLFSVSDRGNIIAHPHATAVDKPGPGGVDLKALVDELSKRGISTPLLLRFPDVLARRVEMLNEAFNAAIKEYDYEGGYQGVYPIKVNQHFHVVKRIIEAGERYRFGLEAGSKPEILAAIAMLRTPGALLICNGYKDVEYVEMGLLAQKLGLKVILVVEKPSELHLIATAAERLGIPPQIGIRVRLSSRGSGRWQQSGGDRSKFGLNSRELVDAVEYLRAKNLLDRFQLLHFHLGSQISAISSVKNALREAGRFYVELVKMGASGLTYFDVGGGLAVDYDGSQTNFASSMNYTMQEYARDIVDALGEVCDQAQVRTPTIVSESGRAVTAHHAILVVDVLGVNALAPKMPPQCPDDAEPVVRKLWETQAELSSKNILESYHDALDYKEEALQLFNLGHLSLTQRVFAENIFWALSARIRKLMRDLPQIPEELEGLESAMSDTFFCNFSLFQSLPDSWAVKQLFPVAPIHRLNEKPARRGILADITCDSDGQISQFIDPHDVKHFIELHELQADENYHVGIFMVGAYQEILGDMHNLFGDTNEVHVTCDEGDYNDYKIEHVIEGETVEEVLQYVGYSRKQLIDNLRRAVEQALKNKHMSLEESRNLIQVFERGLSGYTYLERE